eukprot:TRINITY_DN1568_c0_g1_i1.p1 TRINITY_DN1568_c0_g1~~TRINITY_DN1568_c0_g1_i1.p1  ORF type:complete len:389 (-),score=79.66 TRINITY_DN1568_c0_g1_i1:99-1235(-)
MSSSRSPSPPLDSPNKDDIQTSQISQQQSQQDQEHVGVSDQRDHHHQSDDLDQSVVKRDVSTPSLDDISSEQYVRHDGTEERHQRRSYERSRDRYERDDCYDQRDSYERGHSHVRDDRGYQYDPRDSRSRSRVVNDEHRSYHSDNDATLYICGFVPHVKERDVVELFQKYGSIISIKIILDPHTGDSRGFGFVRLDSLEGAEFAIKELNGTEFMGRLLTVQLSKRKGARPPTPGIYLGVQKYDTRSRRYEQGYRDTGSYTEYRESRRESYYYDRPYDGHPSPYMDRREYYPHDYQRVHHQGGHRDDYRNPRDYHIDDYRHPRDHYREDFKDPRQYYRDQIREEFRDPRDYYRDEYRDPRDHLRDERSNDYQRQSSTYY